MKAAVCLLLMVGCSVPTPVADPTKFVLMSAREPVRNRAVAKRVIVFVPGIYTTPGAVNDWDEAAVRWTNQNVTDAVGDRLEYASGVLHSIGAAQRAADLAFVIRSYTEAGVPVTVVAHSAGCDLLCFTVADPAVSLRNAVLLSPACERDWSKNGMGLAQWNGRLGPVLVGLASDDSAVGFWARLSRWPPWGWVPGFAFGTMGADGPCGIWPEIADKVKLWPVPGGHSEAWFDPPVFTATMMRVSEQ